MGKKKNAYFLIVKHEVKLSLGDLVIVWKIILKWVLQK
jgi:hypothetical protein